MARVWELSRQKGTDLLMLLAIADFADDDGRAYPSVATLAAKCRITTTRHAIRVLRGLKDSGELEIRDNEGPRGTNLYRVTLARPLTPGSPLTQETPLTPVSATPDAGVQKPLTPTPAEPSRNHQGTKREDSNGTRLPHDWSLTAELRAYCQRRRPDLDPDALAEDFRDYWAAQPGKDGVKADWAATFRSWVRRERVGGTAPSRGRADPMEATEQLGGVGA